MNSLDFRAAGAKRFKDKVCIVTGGGQGIGRAVARRLGEEGGTVIIADKVAEAANQVLAELSSHNVQGEALSCDLSKLAEAERLMKTVSEKYGKIDVLINNIGGTIWIRPFWEYTEEQCLLEIERSFWTTMWCSRAVLPYMLQQENGSIVNVGSTSPRGIYRVPYAAAKGGIFALTTSLSREVAQKGIRVNCVAPGATKVEDRLTPRIPLTTQMSEEEQRWRRELNESFKTQYPMGRWSTPEEQAAAIAFMASEDSSFITGQILTVGGGETVP